MATLLRSALQILSLAVEADESSLFDEAARLYDRGSGLLEQYLRSPPPSYQAASIVKSKLESYQQRSKYIKLKLGQAEVHRSTSPLPDPSHPYTNTTSWVSSPSSSTSTVHPIQQPADTSQFPSVAAATRASSSKTATSPSQTPMTDLQHALDLAKNARDEDDKSNFAAAFSAYKKCVDYFVRVIRTEPNDLIRVSLTKTAKTYISRAEQLKEFLTSTKTQIEPDQPEEFSEISDLSDAVIPEQLKLRENSDMRVGPLAKEKSTSFWNDSEKLFFRVDIGHNLVHPSQKLPISLHVDNRTTVAVSSIKIYLEELEISTTPDKTGQIHSTITPIPINKCQYVKKGVFPLTQGTYDGSVQYEIPAYVRPTDADHSSSFAREHVLKLQCDIPRHKNLVLEFPLRVLRASDAEPKSDM